MKELTILLSTIFLIIAGGMYYNGDKIDSLFYFCLSITTQLDVLIFYKGEK